MIANKDYALIKAIKNRCKCNGNSSSEGGGSIDLDSMSVEELSNLMYQASIQAQTILIEQAIEQSAGGNTESLEATLSILQNAPKNVSDVTSEGNIRRVSFDSDPSVSSIVSIDYTNLAYPVIKISIHDDDV